MAYDGNISFYSDQAFAAEEWAASVFDHTGAKKKVQVRGYDLSRFVREEVTGRLLPRGNSEPYVLMKLDIEGAEVDVIGRMLATSTLCTKHVNEIFLEWHKRYQPQGPIRDRAVWTQKNIHRLLDLDPDNCNATIINSLDDESFLHDGKALPVECLDAGIST